jgi:hypothetical protein
MKQPNHDKELFDFLDFLLFICVVGVVVLALAMWSPQW